MKITLLSFFFLAFTFALSTALAALDAEPLLDKNGKPVLNGDLCILEPATKGNGGGLEPFAIGDHTCPISVRQSPSGSFLGQSVFIMVNSKQKGDDVYPTDSLDIMFAGKPVCANSSNWIVKHLFPLPAVFIGEKNGRTMSGLFHIQKYDDAYKVVFCSNSLFRTCWGLGIGVSGDRRLVFNELNPYKFVIRSLSRRATQP